MSVVGELDIKALVSLLDEVRQHLPAHPTSVDSPARRAETVHATLSAFAKAGCKLAVVAPVDAPKQEEVDAVVFGARRYGGGFMQALATALQLADSDNRIRIKTAFHDLWAKYHDLGKIAIEMDRRAAAEMDK